MTEGGRTGRLTSGDVRIFYRAFGAPGRTPILCMHGSNYFDSYDWLGICRTLASDRETASFDKRGFGETTWSPSKDYSVEANMADILAVIDTLGWDKPIVAGHSSSGRLAIAFAAHFPERISRLVVVDSGMDHDAGGPRASIGNAPAMFASVDAAMAHFAKLSNAPRISRDRERAAQALVRVDGGFQLKRDPNFQNTLRPDANASSLSRPARDVWTLLGDVKCPILMVRGERSDRWKPDILTRLRDYPTIEWAMVDSQHDVPFQDPDGLVAAMRHFIGSA